MTDPIGIAAITLIILSPLIGWILAQGYLRELDRLDSIKKLIDEIEKNPKPKKKAKSKAA